jgi:hypothetical protein
MCSALCAMGVFFHLTICLLAHLRERLWLKLCDYKEENEKNVRLQIAKNKVEHNQEISKKEAAHNNEAFSPM